MPGKRPRARPPRSGSPMRHVDAATPEAAARCATYVGSPKHKKGAFMGQVGRPRARPTTVEQAMQHPPISPFTMLCPDRWNNRDPAGEATQLLRAILRGQIGHPYGGRWTARIRMGARSEVIRLSMRLEGSPFLRTATRHIR